MVVATFLSGFTVVDFCSERPEISSIPIPRFQVRQLGCVHVCPLTLYQLLLFTVRF